MRIMWRAWFEAFRLIFTTKFLLRTSGPIIVSLLLVCGGYLFDTQFRTEWSFEVIGNVVAFYLLFVEFSIAWVHIAYSPNGSAALRYLPTRRTMRFAGTLLMLLCAATLILIFFEALSTLVNGPPRSWVSGVVGLGLFYTFSRLVIVFPLIALDKDFTFDQAWRVTRAVQWPLFVTSLVSFFPFMFAWPPIADAIDDYTSVSLSPYLNELVYWPLNYVIQAFSVAAWVLICKDKIASFQNLGGRVTEQARVQV